MQSYIEWLKTKGKHHGLVVILFIVLATSIIFIEPMYHNAYAFFRWGDLSFHTSRMLSLSNVMDSPTNFNYFGNMGSPVNMMYPWLFILPWYGIYLLCGHQLFLSYYIYSAIIIFFTLAIAYIVAYDWLHQRLKSVAISIVYTFAFYHIWGISYRASVGENLSFMVMPLLLLSIRYLFFFDHPSWKMLAITMGLLCYMHYLSLLLYSIVIIFFILSFLLTHRLTRQHIIALAKATMVTVLVGCGSLIPMFLFSITNHLALPAKGDVASRVLSFSQFFDNTWNTHLGRDAQTCGLIILLLAIVSLIYFYHASFFEKNIIVLGWISLLLALPVFDWTNYQYGILGAFQFPWRFFALTTLCFSYVGMKALYHYFSYQKLVSLTMIIATLLSFIYYEKTYETTVKDDKKSYQPITEQVLHRVVHGDIQWQGSGQYDYAKEDAMTVKQAFNHHYMRYNYHYIAIQPKVTSDQWQCQLTVPKKGSVILPVFANQGVSVYIDGKYQPLKEGFNGGVEVTLTAGRHRVLMTASYPIYTYLCWLISIISVIIFFIYPLINKK